jgi:hypothetical protein
MIKGFDDEFSTHDWSNSTQARTLINQAKQIIAQNPTKSALRPIVIKLYDLLPDVETGGPITDKDVLTN